VKTLKALVRDGQWEEARRRLRDLTFASTRYSEFNALSRVHARLLAAQPASERTQELKVALLGVGTTDMIAPALSLAIAVRGVACAIHRADFGSYAREMLDPNSDTIRFDPDVAVIVNSPTNLPTRPVIGQSADEVKTLVDQVTDHWLDLCRSLHEHTQCQIILDNFHALALRPLGNLATKTPWDINTFLRRVNAELAARAPEFVHINDVEFLAARHGLAQWFDSRLWYHAKLPIAPECLPAYAMNTASVIAAIYGRSAKCVVLDLDNTLWGGVIGDDGLDGIQLGQGNAEGEAFLAFQRYLLELKNLGVLLAISSKNDEETALSVFERHPEMLLSCDDIVSFQANWGPKPDSLRAIARELEIGLDALVFVDDNPRERDIVRQWLPEVRVVELSEDVSDFPTLLDETGWFETVHISAEDRSKTEKYRANAARVALQGSGGGDYDGYLRSLAQIGVVTNFEAEDLDRIAQLINKSNQFNLTTRRQTRAEVEAEMRDSERVTSTVRLADRFGDNGLICVFSSRRNQSYLEIDQWLMSCRVLNRGVEHLLLNWVVEKARALDIAEIRGTFIPTQKNALVRDHYSSLGFERILEDDAEPDITRWRLRVRDFTAFEVPIDLEEETNR
jgi:FkbH-like protein